MDEGWRIFISHMILMVTVCSLPTQKYLSDSLICVLMFLCLYCIGLHILYNIIYFLEKIFFYKEKNNNNKTSKISYQPPAPSLVNNDSLSIEYTADELFRDFAFGKVNESRIPQNLKGYYQSLLTQQAQTKKHQEEAVEKLKRQQVNYYTGNELFEAIINNRVDESRIRPETLKYYNTVKEQKTQQLENVAVKKQQDSDYYYKRKMARKGYWKVTPKQIREMDWREFETFVANLLTEHGYKTILTPAQNDEGKDIVAEKDGIKYFIECKHWKEGSSVGREYLQKLVGAAAGSGVTNVIFIATCSFHDNAKVYAKEINKSNMFHLELWNMNKLLEVANSIPGNKYQEQKLFN